MQAITALAHLKATILFMMDVSEQCDHTIEEQYKLFESIQPLFQNKPVFVGLNKTDIMRRADLAPEKEEILKCIEAENIPVIEISTFTEEGLMDLKNKVILKFQLK